MFGIGIFELLVILIVAIIALGPNKLPQTIIDIVKFFRAVRKTMAEAKESFDKEIELSEIKQEALKYKNTISNEVDKLTQDMKLDELREFNINDLSDSLKPLQESLTDTKKELDKEANALHSTLKSLNTELSYESLDSKSEDSKNAESNMPHATAQNPESAESTQDSTLTYKNATSSKSQDSTQHIG
ncbi:Sec-independent protein translocase protein TatB [Helicobacter cinaedi]|uniref:Sec-independent protein translocase protein TatB n=1 Tax=Helicobacter cinaedi TaxID=213 RepID=UPI001EED32B7|nr:Sec-independent protein translocase protein TatB [Helicobacter cinaedi]BDB64240.1 Sec-independent protein translocase protein TatB [Helicobacter cinaedi]